MRAVVIRQFGDPKLLKLEEIPIPSSAAGEVLIAVKAAAINPSDVKNVEGAMHGTTLPRIPGRDFAGVIEKGSAELIGREVWGTGGDVGFTRDGSHAEYLLLPAAAVTAKPARLTMEAAGAAGLTFVTAWSAMVTAAEAAAGETAIIFGAAGGVGSAAVQIAKARGCRVVGVVRSEEDAAAAKQNGADEVVNSKVGSATDALKAITDGHGAQVVFDTSGMMFAESIEAAAMDGRISIISAPANGMATFNLRNLYRKTLRVVGVDTRKLDVVECAALLKQMLPYFESGQFTSVTGQTRPLAEAAAAYEQASQGRGRVILQPDL